MGKICVEENESIYEQGKNCLGLRKVLGIKWDTKKDLFLFKFDKTIQQAKDLEFTKRNLLKISPITLQVNFYLNCSVQTRVIGMMN